MNARSTKLGLGRPLRVQTLDDRVYEAIRDEIVHGLAPGTPLRLADLAAEFGVSIMPVRAALARLEADGLVRQQPHRGAVVSPLELDDLQEIQALRAGLEGYAARLGAERIAEPELRRMRVLLTRLQEATTPGALDTYLALSAEFHDTCYAAAGRTRLLALVAGHRRAAERYIRAVLTRTPGFADSAAHQERFLAACEAHDGDMAERELRSALAWITNRVAKILTEPAAASTA
jgi:DNA-binding GntR family transcriptional regulator